MPWATTSSSRSARVVEINVNAHSLGIEVKHDEERINDILIPKNTQLPTAASRVYRTVVGEPVEGAREGAAGRGAPGRRLHQHRRVLDRGAAAESAEGARRSRCAAAVGSNGLIDVMALDMTSGKMARADIHRASGLSDEEIAREADLVRSLKIQ